MAFDATINLGNVITLAATIAGGFYAYHKWDIKTELRHQDHKNQIANIDQKVNRLESKIDENTKTTNGVSDRVIDLNIKMEKHVVADDIVQKEILRRMDKNENRS